MADLQPIFDKLDSVLSAQVAQEANLNGIAVAVAALVAEIQALQAQLASGTPISQADFDKLTTKTAAVADETTKLGGIEDSIAASDKAPA